MDIVTCIIKPTHRIAVLTSVNRLPKYSIQDYNCPNLSLVTFERGTERERKKKKQICWCALKFMCIIQSNKFIHISRYYEYGTEEEKNRSINKRHMHNINVITTNIDTESIWTRLCFQISLKKARERDKSSTKNYHKQNSTKNGKKRTNRT